MSTVCQAAVIDEKQFSFKVVTNGEELVLGATNDVDRDEWIEAITGAISQPSVTASNAEAVMDVAAEIDRVRIEKEKLAADEANKILMQKQPTAAADPKKELAAKKLAADLAEKRRKEAATVLLQEQETSAAKAAVLDRVNVPVECEKKLSTETEFKIRFLWINEKTKELHWAKNEGDFEGGKSKAINVTQHVKSITVDNAVSFTKFSINLVKADKLPDHMHVKSVFNVTAPTSIDIQIKNNAVGNAFIYLLRDLKK